MQVRFLLGPAGSGKTYRCLEEIGQELRESAEGAPLLLVAPRQTTYQLERQLLSQPELPGYTRLHILSFERLADFVFERLGKPVPRMLEEEGRLMVLRSLLGRKREQLKLFRASARLTGFAQQLSLTLSELQRNQQTPESLRELASQIRGNVALACKLDDLAVLLGEYVGWLKGHGLQDAEGRLSEAAGALDKSKVHGPQSTDHGRRTTDYGPRTTGQRTEDRGQEGNTKNQTPNSKETPNSKFQTSSSKPGRAEERKQGSESVESSLDTGRSTLSAPSALHVSGVWVDGFGDLSAQELELLAALMPCCERATLTFCLDEEPKRKVPWMSSWSVAAQGFEECRQRMARVPGAEVRVEVLERAPDRGRFGTNPVLAHLEEAWEERRRYEGQGTNTKHPPSLRFGAASQTPNTKETPNSKLQGPAGTADRGQRTVDCGLRTVDSLRVAICANPEAEAVVAAREILEHVRAGGRYREVTVLVRRLEDYYEPLQRIFSRYEIPFFLDRRENVSHHPLAELTRSAVRTVALGWQQEDWFAALKTDLAPVGEKEIDRLETEALERGWKGPIWETPIKVKDDAELTKWLEEVHGKVLPPFLRLKLGLSAGQRRPDGAQMASALRRFWQDLDVEGRLNEWAQAPTVNAGSRIPESVHTTVWEQMNGWLENLELAFAGEQVPLKDWLPILEAGFSNLSVGVIPPALDQVFVGAIDRSRNPDLKLALVLGLNENVFPAPLAANLLLSEADRVELEKRNVVLGATARRHAARERHYGYIACTRARDRLVLTSAGQDACGLPLNPSPFLSHIRQVFPTIEFEHPAAETDWRQSQHVSELIGAVLGQSTDHGTTGPQDHRTTGPQTTDHGQGDRGQEKNTKHQTPNTKETPNSKLQTSGKPQALRSESCSAEDGEHEANTKHQTPNSKEDSVTRPSTLDTQYATRNTQHALLPSPLDRLGALPAVAAVLDQLRHLGEASEREPLSPELAGRLYGPVLRTSVSRLEQFAACPFKFFAHSGLRAEERRVFELDRREQGSFQHDALAQFHQGLRQESKRWRDVTAAEAQQRMERICTGLAVSYRDGLLQTSEQSRFMARAMSEALQDFVGTLVGWMHEQYRFDPVAVELPFGEGAEADGWVVELGPAGGDPKLVLTGRIDRVDLCSPGEDEATLCVVVDYKSSGKKLDALLVANGLQLQLLAYLNVLRRWGDPERTFGVTKLVPAGVFYVSLRGEYEGARHRGEALAGPEEARKLAYQHRGRFDAGALPWLDARPGAASGDQFKYRLRKDGQLYAGSVEALDTARFWALLDSVEANLKKMGQEIFAGRAELDPYRKDKMTACDQCSYSSICRIDPWTHAFRVLKPTG